MASNVYTQLVTTVSSYIGQEKAVNSIGRQLARCEATPDTFTVEHLRGILNHVTCATTLYLAPNKDKQKALADRIKALI